MSEPQRIVLVGFMGAGKSTVGRLLAARVAWNFCDLDALIENRTGLSVGAIFAAHGEPRFREEELLAAREAARWSRHVIAAGGGAWVQPATRDALARGGRTIWLRCPLRVLQTRIQTGGPRPMVANHATMARLLQVREAAYRLADLTVEASEASPEEIASQIAMSVFEGHTSPAGGRHKSGT